VDARLLNDPHVSPTDDMIFAHLGKRRALWDALFEFIRVDHPDCVARWRYYNDGKSWLMNVSRKKKTVFWLAVVPGSFRITAYFTDKAREAILASPLSSELKEAFVSGRSFGKLRGITIAFKKKDDVKDAKALIALKLSQK